MRTPQARLGSFSFKATEKEIPRKTGRHGPTQASAYISIYRHRC